MKLSLSENIRALRKEKGLTQEGLAEVLGVTTGAVHKWEAGLSTPELEMIVRMADLFSTSVDSLLGYKVQDDRREAIMDRMAAHCRRLDPEGIPEAEKALLKYPNNFEVVHLCACTYLIYGMEQHNNGQVRRGLELLEKSILLLPQNKSPRISEHTIYNEIAAAYYFLGEADKSVELMKKNNIGGLFSSGIGVILAFRDRADEAEPYLADALTSETSGIMEVVAGYAMVFFSRGDYVSAGSILDWGGEVILGLKHEDGTGFADKVQAELLVLKAHALLKTEEKDKAFTAMEKAAEIAKRFDSAPDFGFASLKYVSNVENSSVHDVFGATAAESIGTMLGFLGDAETTALWEAARDAEGGN